MNQKGHIQSGPSSAKNGSVVVKLIYYDFKHWMFGMCCYFLWPGPEHETMGPLDTWSPLTLTNVCIIVFEIFILLEESTKVLLPLILILWLLTKEPYYRKSDLKQSPNCCDYFADKTYKTQGHWNNAVTVPIILYTVPCFSQKK